jgi:hypothetical protein
MDYSPTQMTGQQVLIHAFQQERDLAIGVNITGTRGSNDDPVEQAVDRKSNFHLARCNADFTIIVVDSIGEFHPDAAELITGIAVAGHTVFIS